MNDMSNPMSSIISGISQAKDIIQQFEGCYDLHSKIMEAQDEFEKVMKNN